MIALEVKRNGKRVCLAGAGNMMVLSADVTAYGKLGEKSVPRRLDDPITLTYTVGGLIPQPNGKDVFPKWKDAAPLRVGDVIEVRIVETDQVDRPTARRKAKRKKV